MPGIYGFVQKRRFDPDANRALIQAMRTALEHTEGYVSDVYSCDWCGLGNTGLPVTGQKRFMADEQAGLAGALSGYVYGWKENGSIKPVGDGDLIGHITRQQPERLVETIDGSFNVVVADLKARNLRLGNDRFGHRQLYLLDTDDIFMFATEIKALMAYDRFDRSLDQHAIFDYFNYTYPLTDRTFFKHVKLLAGGHQVAVDSTGVRTQPYWTYAFGEVSSATVPELIEEVDGIYRDHIKRVIGPADELVLPLSGGLDSRFIAAHVVQLGKTPRLFSHGARGCNEEKIARRVGKTLGLADQYTFVDIDPLWLIDYSERFVRLTEGMVHTGPCMLLGITDQYDMPRADSVFLNGIFGGPTNFGSGYFRQYDMAEPPDRTAKLNSLKRSMFGFNLSDQYYATFHPGIRADLKAAYLSSIDTEFRKYESVSEHFYNQKDIFFIKNRLTRFMNQVDCNRFGWHDHFALISDRLVDFYLALPPDLKLGRKFFTEYFKAKFPAMAAITYQATGVNLYQSPSPLAKRLKKYKNKLRYYTERSTFGLVSLADPDQYYQYDQWYRKYPRIRSFYEELLLDDRTFARGYLDRPGTEQLLKRQRDGGNGFFDISSIAGFEMFCRLFVDR